MPDYLAPVRFRRCPECGKLLAHTRTLVDPVQPDVRYDVYWCLPCKRRFKAEYPEGELIDVGDCPPTS